MLGYKGTRGDMTCRGFQYEIGKTYEMEGKPELCEKGFHFCKDLRKVFSYYPLQNDNRFFIVEADDGSTIVGKGKCVTSRIKIVRELLPIEVSRCYYSRRGEGCGECYGSGDGSNSGRCNGCGYGNGWGYNYRRQHTGDGNCYGYSYGMGKGMGNGNHYSSINEILIYKQEEEKNETTHSI